MNELSNIEICFREILKRTGGNPGCGDPVNNIASNGLDWQHKRDNEPELPGIES